MPNYKKKTRRKGRPRKVDMIKLYEMLEQGYSQAECARHFDVDPRHLSRLIKNAGWRNVKAILEKEPWADVPDYHHDPAVVIMDRRLDIVKQLHQINSHTWRILQSEMDKMDAGDKRRPPNRKLILDCVREIRKQLDSQVAWEKIYFDARDVRRFFEVVLGAIERSAPDVRKEIVREIKRRRALSIID